MGSAHILVQLQARRQCQCAHFYTMELNTDYPSTKLILILVVLGITNSSPATAWVVWADNVVHSKAVDVIQATSKRARHNHHIHHGWKLLIASKWSNICFEELWNAMRCGAALKNCCHTMKVQSRLSHRPETKKNDRRLSLIHSHDVIYITLRRQPVSSLPNSFPSSSSALWLQLRVCLLGPLPCYRYRHRLRLCGAQSIIKRVGRDW